MIICEHIFKRLLGIFAFLFDSFESAERQETGREVYDMQQRSSARIEQLMQLLCGMHLNH